ncbi:MAG: hypothetical protein OSA87_05990 [Woeseiaceae bacterium]|nr:hypothetical protein [Woeseiaceae bacterium]
MAEKQNYLPLVSDCGRYNLRWVNTAWRVGAHPGIHARDLIWEDAPEDHRQITVLSIQLRGNVEVIIAGRGGGLYR